MNREEAHQPDVAIVVLNWGRTDLLRECLNSIFNLNTRARVHLVVFDNESDLESRSNIAEIIQSGSGHANCRPRSLTLLSSPINLGFAAAMNRAIEFCREKHAPDCIWLLNNDVEVSPGTLDALLDAAEAHQGWGILGVPIRGEALARGELLYGGYRYQNWASRLKPCLRPDQVPDYIAGAAMLVRTQVFADVGLLSEDFFLYGEELDLALRARAAGWSCGCADQGLLWHDSGQTIALQSPLPGRTPQWAREFFENRSAFLLTRKHFGHWLPAVIFFRVLIKGMRALLGKCEWGAVVAALSSYRKPLPESLSGPRIVDCVNLKAGS